MAPFERSTVRESDLIEMLSRGLLFDERGVVRGVGDDCAVLEAGNARVWLVTVDQQIEGVHFLPDVSSAADIGHKALAVSLSDIAAMGGTPRHAFLTIAFPANAGADFASGFRDGFGQLAQRFSVNLLGGDVARSSSGLFVTVAVLGEAERDRVLYREGARVGDRVFVTGHLGLAAAGLEQLRSQKRSRAAVSATLRDDPLMQALLRPEPRVQEGHLLAASGAVTACIDVSDGLALDLTRLCTRSSAGVRVEEAAVPLAESLLNHTGGDRERALALALVGGEDYELCFTVRAEAASSLRGQLGSKLDVLLTEIGEVVAREEGFLRVREGRTPSPLAGGFDHFVD